MNDVENPSVTCPGDFTVQAAEGASSAVVNFEATGADNCTGVSVQSDPPSGSSFPIGQTTVNTTATDAKGNTAACSFIVTVEAAPPTPTPTATPPVLPTRLGNISTRLRVETGLNVLIGGFIITGDGDKTFIARGIGPSLGFDGASRIRLELYNSEGGLVAENDNWEDSPNKQAIIDSTIPPSHPLEAAIVETLAPAAYTAIVSGVDVAPVLAWSKCMTLRATSTEIRQHQHARVVRTGRQCDDWRHDHPRRPAEEGDHSRHRSVVAGGRQAEDPTLELFDGEGTSIATNDNWRDTQENEIAATGVPPTDDRESAIVRDPYSGCVYRDRPRSRRHHRCGAGRSVCAAMSREALLMELLFHSTVNSW